MDHYPGNIRKGIVLHRRIDSFTDSHHVVSDTKAMMRPTFGRYSGIVLDMYFDYFLAVNFRTLSHGKSLRFFAYKFYVAALLNFHHLPERVRRFIFHFITTNRLLQYQSLEGLRTSLDIMSNRKIPSLDPGKIIEYLIEHKAELERRFLLFFHDLEEFVKNEQL